MVVTHLVTAVTQATPHRTAHHTANRTPHHTVLRTVPATQAHGVPGMAVHQAIPLTVQAIQAIQVARPTQVAGIQDMEAMVDTAVHPMEATHMDSISQLLSVVTKIYLFVCSSFFLR